MAGVFPVQGFGFLSNYNGAFVTSSALAAMKAIAGTNANSIEFAPRLFMQTRTSNDVFAHPAKTESDANILQAMANAQALGLSVTLKPMVSALDGGLAYVLNPSDPASFFLSYKRQMVHMAELAEQADVSIFVIGNELGKISGPEYRSYWVDLIDSIRAVFHGEITYAAATDEAINVSFWDKVDVIGINAYPPLTTTTEPTVEEMVNAWNSMSTDDYWAKVMNHMSPVDFFHSLALQYDKQVFFTETGYRSVDGTNISPGGWAEGTTQDVQEQYDAFNAFFQVWASEGGSWFRGASIWNWDTNNKYSPIGYSPQGKPARELITEWYGGQHQPPGQNLTGSPSADLMDVGGGNDVLSGGVGNDTIKSGGGDDSVTGGPDIIPKLAETTITVTGYGSVVDGVGAEMQLLINGQQVGNTVEFRSATDASGFQTFTFTFANPATVSSLDLAFVNDVANANGDRNLYIKDITVNGEHLAAADAVNPSSPGTWNLYQNKSIHYDMTAHQDLFFGSSTDNDNLDGGAGKDVINGGAGTDMIQGGAGNDTINGGPGADVIHGGAEDDTINSGSGVTTATDQLYGDDGNDIIKATTGDTGALLDGGAGKDQLYGSWAANVMNGGDGNDYLSGSGGLDIMHGDAGDDQLKGGTAATQMSGDDGNDSLQGGTGNEFLYGGSGNDRLTGGGGNDYLAGGSGNDTFVFAAGFGKDTVADFQNTDGVQDLIQIDKTVLADFNAVQSHMIQGGTSVVITLDANNTIEIKNTTLDQLHASDFWFI
ncbi:calcium-binding protein [Bradyrhizobium sp. WSM 1738]|uniref:glycoside hydrolase family 113 n=1 Tax=Bradyrhizobium hereditatis TaxID=2821405 RepID=UPI0024C08232|nr:carbohydrate-binding domain-containing protein [Bradyrhizobium hereditatis]MCA6115016.1 calcium-binding protein [Bradyrhizobium hereditatis]